MTEPIGPGAFVAVVGASGVGKDALLSYAIANAADTVTTRAEPASVVHLEAGGAPAL